MKEEWTTPSSIFKTKKIGKIRKLVLAKRKISEFVEPLDDDDEDIEPTNNGKPSTPKKSKKEKTKTSIVVNIPSSLSKSFDILSTIPEPSIILSAKHQEASVLLTKSSVPIINKKATEDKNLLNFSSPDIVTHRNPIVEEYIRYIFHQSAEPDTNENSDNIGEDDLLKIEVKKRRKREHYIAKEN
ncbi:hypothetical protein OCU04_001853 [Sclerotinia nivalis]|uniref:Uncharacterized protein n=1 Tax=Sclerotinia nivalis TaxID=352851 RepID=A0A9X0DS21_9HELO|nr:hypothetical protein OCU04_001853 [Sclerotinia nivalis]